MEIKVGDKVRVREDAPRMYLRTMSTKFLGAECGVFEIIDGNAAIASGRDYIAIPLKYLVKVEEEKKAPKFKKGDKVKVNLPRSIRHNRIGTVVFAYDSGSAVNVVFGDNDGPVYCDCGCLEPCTEPTEQTEAEKPNHTIKIPVEVDLTDGYWDAYAADLAKEVALKVANKYNGPKEAAEYAVLVAKAVAEGLKRK